MRALLTMRVLYPVYGMPRKSGLSMCCLRWSRRVARGLYARRPVLWGDTAPGRAGPSLNPIPWEHCDATLLIRYCAEARAAIAAMREPNEAVRAHLRAMLADDRGNPVDNDATDPEWQAMILAALKENQKTRNGGFQGSKYPQG